MDEGTKVKHLTSGRLGVTVADPYRMLADGEAAVVLEGDEDETAIPLAELEDLGPENAVADPERCGQGSERCCIFLAFGDGWRCSRFVDVREMILQRHRAGTMNAKRFPTQMFPACQLPAATETES